MEIPALAENDDDRRIGEQQRLHVAVLIDLDVAPAGGAKRRQFCVLELDAAGAGKKLQVFRVRSGIPGFDVVDAVLVEDFEDF